MTEAKRERALATALRMAQWALDDAAFKLPRGDLPNAKRAELAGILRDLASLLLATAPAPRTPGKLQAAIEGGGGDEWPEELELLAGLGESGWTFWAFGDRQRPDALAAVRVADTAADVITIRGHDRVTAYRTPLTPGGDPLRADTVTWHHTSTALEVLREVVPGMPYADDAKPYEAPPECRLPELDRRPITVVPPRCQRS